MNDQPSNISSDETLTIKRVKPRYITIRENIATTLSPYTLKFYMMLRYESDFGESCSSVKKKIKFFQNKANMSRSQVFESIKELEENGLLQRQVNPGYQSIYWVAEDLGHFLPSENESQVVQEPEIDQPGVQQLDGVVQQLDGVVQQLDTITNISSNISYQLKPIVDFQSTESYKDDPLFMQFYSIYPNKQKPEIARKAFYKHKPDQEFVDMLYNDVGLRMANNWKNRHKNKIPFPATYLNSKEWEGEIVPPESTDGRLFGRPKYKTWDDITGVSL